MLVWSLLDLPDPNPLFQLVQFSPEATKAIVPSDSSSGIDRQDNRLGILSFAGISWTSSGSPEFLKACRSSGSRDGVLVIERVP
ncbi:hypothetical protein LINPERPRIM_LOCUS26236 [Linum perenne]